jgi:hypothetical protein
MRRFAILAPKAVTRHMWDPPKPVAPLNAMVVTPGGAASTSLLKHIARFVTVNDCNDADGLKHAPHPPSWFSNTKKTRVIFIDRDIAQTVQSLDRRGYVYEQLAKLGSVIGCLLPDAAAKRTLVKAINRQKRQWRSTKSADVLFIDYDSLWDQVEKIAAFLEITDSNFIRDFPPKDKSRTPTVRAPSPVATGTTSVPDFAIAAPTRASGGTIPSFAKLEHWAIATQSETAFTIPL